MEHVEILNEYCRSPNPILEASKEQIRDLTKKSYRKQILGINKRSIHSAYVFQTVSAALS